MAKRAVDLNVAGQRCRVVTTASEPELRELVALVEDKIATVLGKGRPVNTQALLLAAIALANDVKEQRERADAIAGKAKHSLTTLLTRVDKALQQNESQDKERIRGRGPTPKSRPRGGDDGST